MRKKNQKETQKENLFIQKLISPKLIRSLKIAGIVLFLIIVAIYFVSALSMKINYDPEDDTVQVVAEQPRTSVETVDTGSNLTTVNEIVKTIIPTIAFMIPMIVIIFFALNLVKRY